MFMKNATSLTSSCFYSVKTKLKKNFESNKIIPTLTKNKYALLESYCAFNVKGIFFPVQTCISFAAFPVQQAEHLQPSLLYLHSLKSYPETRSHLLHTDSINPFLLHII